MFVHQTKWQKRLLNLYGSEICLLDATYNTSKYELPLFFICVNTNVGYINVATFIVSDETSSSIVEGLKIIRDWNKDWEPPYFMTDNDSSEIAALEELFPGNLINFTEFSFRWMNVTSKHHHSRVECKRTILPCCL